jgi:hypothetical protein
MPKDTPPTEFDPNQPSPQNRIKTAFVQVPVGIKEQVEAYIKDLMESRS